MNTLVNMPDASSSTEEIVGTNVPEFFKSLEAAASFALGYYWAPVTVWRDSGNKRVFVCAKKGETPRSPKPAGQWEKICTVTPHTAGKSL